MAERRIVWLASYPKSGNTWARVLLAAILLPESTATADAIATIGHIASDRPAFDALTGHSSTDLTDDEVDLLRPSAFRMVAGRVSQPVFIKTHEMCHANGAGEPLFPPECSMGAIHIVRHPFDVAVSYAHHRAQEGYDDVIALMNAEDAVLHGGRKEQLRQRTGSWSGHFRSWQSRSAMPALLVRYEDMLEDAGRELRRMLDFAGIEQGAWTCSVEDAVRRANFDRLTKLESERGFAERPVKAARFFRSGRAGEGMEKLSQAQRQSIIEAHQKVMRELGYL